MTDPQCPFCGTLLNEHEANDCLDIWAHCVRHSANRSGGPAYSRNIAAAMELEAEIERAGLLARYVHALGRIASSGDDLPGCGANYSLWWRLAHATPEQRTKAYIAAMSKEPANA